MFEPNKAKTFLVIAILIAMLFSFCFVSLDVRAESATFTVSGYVLDSNGQGIANANVIFYSQASVKTNGTGYYQISKPAGTYYLNVWPPFDSNFFSYSEKDFSLSSDITKNITLATGFKVSGYVILASTGSPVVGACVFLNGSGSGWFTNASGYYFVCVQGGTYTINAHPRTDTYANTATSFQEYCESNFVVTCDTIKNITVNAPAPTSTTDGAKCKIYGYITDSTGKGIPNAQVIFNVPSIVTPVYSNANGYYEISAPTGSYHVNVWPPFDSNYISYDQPQLTVSSDICKNITLATGFKVYGFISDYSGYPVSKAIVILSGQTSGWFSKADGYYALAVPAGTYKIDAHPGKDANGNSIANFPIYYECNFTVSGDTRKNIIVGTPPTTPTPTAPNDAPKFESQNNTVSPSPSPIISLTTQPNAEMPVVGQNQAKIAGPTFAVSIPENQQAESSLVEWIVGISITVVLTVALMTLIWIYRGKQAVIGAAR